MNWPPEMRQFQAGDRKENIRLKVLADFMAAENRWTIYYCLRIYHLTTGTICASNPKYR